MQQADFAKIRAELEEKHLKGAIPNYVWRELLNQGLPYAVEYRDPEAWPTMVGEAKKLLRIWNAAQRSDPLSPRADAAAVGGDSERPVRHVDRSLLNQWEAEFRSALQIILACNAAGYRRVRSFRERYLENVLLSTEEANALLASPATRILRWRDFKRHSIPIVGHRVEAISHPFPEIETELARVEATLDMAWSGGACRVSRILGPQGLRRWQYEDPLMETPGETGWADRVRVWPGSLLDGLRRLARHLAFWCCWQEQQAAIFVLTGHTPQVVLAGWRAAGSQDGPIPGGVVLTFNPVLSVESMSRIIRHIQGREGEWRKLLRKRGDGRKLAVYAFVTAHSRDGGRKAWRPLMEEWNATCRGPYESWAYTEPSRFQDDCGDGKKAFEEVLRASGYSLPF